MNINLTREECDYLIKGLLNSHKEILSQLVFFEDSNNLISVELDKSTGHNIRKIANNRLRLHYLDKDYERTKEDSILECLINKLYKIKIKVNLTREEYDYLISNLLNSHKEIFSQLVFFEDSNNLIGVELEEGMANNIRELAGDEVGLHFDKNYKPTKAGWILEHLIDKFFIE
jgi:hypothetical protein